MSCTNLRKPNAGAGLQTPSLYLVLAKVSTKSKDLPAFALPKRPSSATSANFSRSICRAFIKQHENSVQWFSTFPPDLSQAGYLLGTWQVRRAHSLARDNSLLAVGSITTFQLYQGYFLATDVHVTLALRVVEIAKHHSTSTYSQAFASFVEHGCRSQKGALGTRHQATPQQDRAPKKGATPKRCNVSCRSAEKECAFRAQVPRLPNNRASCVFKKPVNCV